MDLPLAFSCRAVMLGRYINERRMSVSDPSFANIVRDLVVNEQDYAYEMSQTTPPERTYVITFMARSGSSCRADKRSAIRHLRARHSGRRFRLFRPTFVRRSLPEDRFPACSNSRHIARVPRIFEMRNTAIPPGAGRGRV